MEKNILCSYTMTDDTGFAPNPYHGILTLATCKPQIRRSERVKEGVWIAGWAGKALQQNGGRELIYLAQVSKKIPLGEYYENYKEKRPLLIEESYMEHKKDEKKRCSRIKASAENNPDIMGDNIYKLNRLSGLLEWQPNNFHTSDCAEHDTNGQNAIICNEFYYFGGNKGKHLFVPEEYRIRMPKRYTVFTEDSQIDNPVTAFINFVRQHSNEATIKRDKDESNI